MKTGQIFYSDTAVLDLWRSWLTYSIFLLNSINWPVYNTHKGFCELLLTVYLLIFIFVSNAWKICVFSGTELTLGFEGLPTALSWCYGWQSTLGHWSPHASLKLIKTQTEIWSLRDRIGSRHHSVATHVRVITSADSCYKHRLSWLDVNCDLREKRVVTAEERVSREGG